MHYLKQILYLFEPSSTFKMAVFTLFFFVDQSQKFNRQYVNETSAMGAILLP